MGMMAMGAQAMIDEMKRKAKAFGHRPDNLGCPFCGKSLVWASQAPCIDHPAYHKWPKPDLPE